MHQQTLQLWNECKENRKAAPNLTFKDVHSGKLATKKQKQTKKPAHVISKSVMASDLPSSGVPHGLALAPKRVTPNWKNFLAATAAK